MAFGRVPIRISTRFPTRKVDGANMNHPVQFSGSVVSDSVIPMDCGTPGFPVHHQLPELVQTHVHPVSDAIQPSHHVVPFSSSAIA